MIALQKIRTNHKHYHFIEELLHMAFPENERRDDDKQRWKTDNEERFHCLLVTTNDVQQPIGLLTYWDFETFIYVEHLAIDAELQGRGLGSKTLQAFFHRHESMPIVLEVEHPTDETSSRRIGFYEHSGLRLWECDYLQPPYRPGDDWLPLYLMATPTLSREKDYQHICETIHSEVYGIKEAKEK